MTAQVFFFNCFSVKDPHLNAVECNLIFHGYGNDVSNQGRVLSIDMGLHCFLKKSGKSISLF